MPGGSEADQYHVQAPRLGPRLSPESARDSGPDCPFSGRPRFVTGNVHQRRDPF